MKKVVMTGPTGSIGIALIQQCIAQGIRVLAIVRPHSKRTDRIPRSPLVQVVACSLDTLCDLDEKALERAGVESFDYDVCYHFAWEATIGSGRNDMKLQTANIGYALDAVALAARLGCHTFVGAGSQAEYGRWEEKLSEYTPTFPESGYGMAKLCAGAMTRLECSRLGMRHVWARILSVYGPGDGEQTMISMVIRKLLAGEIPALTAGIQQWDYLHCRDAANAMYLLGEKGRDGSIYCVGSGNARPLREYIEILRDCINPALALDFGAVAYGPQQIMYLCADIEKLTEDTGFIPEVNFEDGIRETIGWMRTQEL
ncbi:MAG: NAD(P)-dependent oxidoreductase [Lachnospiraceae bacterium]|nr:NAD(P)-dependent oxidoreductase [Lachnospiraceae bacterium]